MFSNAVISTNGNSRGAMRHLTISFAKRHPAANDIVHIALGIAVMVAIVYAVSFALTMHALDFVPSSGDVILSSSVSNVSIGANGRSSSAYYVTMSDGSIATLPLASCSVERSTVNGPYVEKLADGGSRWTSNGWETYAWDGCSYRLVLPEGYSISE